MKIVFTICSNNYLAQALVLAGSVIKNQPAWKFIIVLVDKKAEPIPYNTFPCDVIEVETIEKDLLPLVQKYSIIELNTCVKPACFQYFFDVRAAEQVIYLDPDCRVYNGLYEIDRCFEEYDFILTPHVLSPVPMDGHTPAEPLFLNYGLYNLGFLALKKTAQTARFLTWWKERTYELGYDKPAVGLFTDQLWINLLPLYFSKVKILKDPGYNMAPWNLHERWLLEEKEGYFVNGSYRLGFFHFSGFHPGKDKLHKNYSRYNTDQRPDLLGLFTEYRAELESENYNFYQAVPCYYVRLRDEHLATLELIRKEEEKKYFRNLPFFKQLVSRVKYFIPGKVKKMAWQLIKV